MKSPFAPRSRSATSLLLLAIALLPGCGHGGGVTTTYIAVIERIEDLEGDHYSPIKGRKPLFQFHLRLARDSTRIDTGLLRG